MVGEICGKKQFLTIKLCLHSIFYATIFFSFWKLYLVVLGCIHINKACNDGNSAQNIALRAVSYLVGFAVDQVA